MPMDNAQHTEFPEASIDAAIAADDVLQLYYRQAAQEPLLTHQQQVTLAQRIHRGQRAARCLAAGTGTAQQVAEWQAHVKAGAGARERFIRANIRLVIHIAKAYQGQGLALVDLIQEGNLGLMRAVSKYDPRQLNADTQQPYRFSTYAVFWIKQTIRRALGRQAYATRLPSHWQEKATQIAILRSEWQQTWQREPTVVEMAERLDMSSEKVAKLLQALLSTPF